MKDPRYDDEYFIPPTTEGADLVKYRTLIKSLIELKQVFTQPDFEFIRADDRTYKYSYRNHQLHYFLFCIDWSDLYTSSTNRLTLYDILRKNINVSEPKEVQKFTDAYDAIKKIFNGEIETAEDLIECRKNIKSRLSEGLNSLLGNKSHKSKALSELFTMLLDNLASVAYNTDDFDKPYLSKDAQRSKVLDIIFGNFIPAIEVAVFFNQNIRTELVNPIKIDDFFVLHVLLRHVVRYKFLYKFFAVKGDKIKDGFGEKCPKNRNLSERWKYFCFIF